MGPWAAWSHGRCPCLLQGLELGGCWGPFQPKPFYAKQHGSHLRKPREDPGIECIWSHSIHLLCRLEDIGVHPLFQNVFWGAAYLLPWATCLPCALHTSKDVTESLRLEKTAKIILSNHQPSASMPTDHIPQCRMPYLKPHGLLFEYSDIQYSWCEITGASSFPTVLRNSGCCPFSGAISWCLASLHPPLCHCDFPRAFCRYNPSVSALFLLFCLRLKNCYLCPNSSPLHPDFGFQEGTGFFSIAWYT